MKKYENSLKWIYVCIFTFHVYAKRNLKNTEISWIGFWCVHFYVPRNSFVSRIRQTQIWKNKKIPEMDFDVYISTLRVNFYLRFTYTPNANLKTTKIPKNGFWCVHFYVLRNFFRFTCTSNANLEKYRNSLKWILICRFLSKTI